MTIPRRDYEQERRERREYEGDVMYEVWRNRGNVDHVNLGRVDDAYWRGHSVREAALREIQEQEPEECDDDRQAMG